MYQVARPYNNDIIVIPNFIDDTSISNIVSMANGLSDEDWSVLNEYSNENFKDKNYSLINYNDNFRELASEQALEIISDVWGISKEDIFLTGFNTMSRSKDLGMPVHSDGGDGLSQKTLYGLVLYLNTCDTDFVGGELYYPNLGIEYKPKAGDLVIHPGSEEYSHGVRDVAFGVRYIITSFAKTVKEY
jgi:hypothetical protein